MLINRKSKLILIHAAKRKLNLSDENYRALLEGAAGISSAAMVDHEGQFRAIMTAFANLGFVSTATAKASKKRAGQAIDVADIKSEARPDTKDWWRCTPDQRAKIESLWALVARNPSHEALRHMATRICKVEAITWLYPRQATMIILALRSMAQRSGYDPDTGERHRVSVCT